MCLVESPNIRYKVAQPTNLDLEIRECIPSVLNFWTQLRAVAQPTILGHVQLMSTEASPQDQYKL